MAALKRAIAGWYGRAGVADRFLAGVFVAIFVVGLILVADGLWMEVTTADAAVETTSDAYAGSVPRLPAN